MRRIVIILLAEVAIIGLMLVGGSLLVSNLTEPDPIPERQEQASPIPDPGECFVYVPYSPGVDMRDCGRENDGVVFGSGENLVLAEQDAWCRALVPKAAADNGPLTGRDLNAVPVTAYRLENNTTLCLAAEPAPADRSFTPPVTLPPGVYENGVPLS